MRIAFDGTTLTAERTGCGYYTEHLLQHLASEVEATGDELIVISNQAVDTVVPLPRHVRVFGGLRFPLRVGWMQLLASRVLDRIKPDVAHFTNAMMPPFTDVPTVVTIHDLSLRLYPRCHPLRRIMINRPLMAVAVRKATAITTVSSNTRRDLLRLHRIAPERVTFVHSAAGPAFQPITDRVRLAHLRRRYELPDRFVLYVGTIEPRKNLVRLMHALAAARRRGMPHALVCAGPYGWSSRDLTATIHRLGLGPHVKFIGYAPVDELTSLYNLAEIFIYPSLYEGFGLPVVEAMACGTPVITSNTSSLAEIAEGAAELVDPMDAEAICHAIVRLASDADRRRELSAHGLARARTFSWTRTAREMIGLYKHAAGIRHRETVPVADPAVAAERARGVAMAPESPGAMT